MATEVSGLLSLWNVVSKFVVRGIAPADYIESFLENVRLFLEQDDANLRCDPFSLRELCQKLDHFSVRKCSDIPAETLEKLNLAASELRKLLRD